MTPRTHPDWRWLARTHVYCPKTGRLMGALGEPVSLPSILPDWTPTGPLYAGPLARFHRAPFNIQAR